MEDSQKHSVTSSPDAAAVIKRAWGGDDDHEQQEPTAATNRESEGVQSEGATGAAAAEHVFRHILQAVVRTDVYSLASAVLLTLALLVTETLGVWALVLPTTVQISVTTAVLCALVVLVLLLIAVQLTFHLLSLQWISCFFLALPVFVAHQLTLMALSFTYSTQTATYNESTSSWSLSVLVLVSVLLAAVCCFVLLVLKFLSNKITSQGWLRHLVQLMREKRALAATLAITRREASSYNKHSHQATVMLDVIMQMQSHGKCVDQLAGVAWMLTQRRLEIHSGAGGSGNKLPISIQNDTSSFANANANANGSGGAGVVPARSDVLVPWSSKAPPPADFARCLAHLRSALSIQSNDQAESEPSFRDGRDKYTLDDVLHHPLGQHILRLCLREQLCEENLRFYIAADMYVNEPSAAVRRELALDLYRTFITTGASEQINLPSAVSSAISDAMYRAQWPTAMFVAAQREVIGLIQTNAWTPFKQTDRYKCKINVTGERERERGTGTTNNVLTCVCACACVSACVL